MFACKKSTVTSQETIDSFSSAIDRGVIENSQIGEASGLAAGLIDTSIFWTHNDTGDKNRLFAIDSLGRGTKEFFVPGAQNWDWEAVAITAFGQQPFIYIGDIGDNDLARSQYTIYRVAEPVQTANTTETAKKILFQYPDGSHDAESLLIDHVTKDIYLITKRENKKRLYRLAFPQAFDKLLTAEFVSEMTFSTGTDVLSYITDGTVAFDNSEIIVKSYLHLYHWRVKKGESIPKALARTPSILPYRLEAQGEAVTFTKNASGYLTLSETSENKIP